MAGASDAAYYERFRSNAIGNALEFFDFAAFGAVGDALSMAFFPSSSSSTMVLQTLCVYGAAFLMRPLGGVVLGHIGDVYGRSRGLEVSIGLMVLPSFLIGSLPTYNQCGTFSIVALILLRLLQGLAAGGEIVGSYVHTLEGASFEHVSFWGGAIKASGNIGSSIAIGLVALLRALFTRDQFYAFGWRIPFWLGLPAGALCMWLRYQQRVSRKQRRLTSRSNAAKDSSAAKGEEWATTAGQVAIEPEPAENDTGVQERDEEDIPGPPMLQHAPPDGRQSRKKMMTAMTTTTNLHAATEPVSFQESRPHNPLLSLSSLWQEIVVTIFLSSIWGVGFYSTCVFNGYMLTNKDMGGALDPSEAWAVLFITSLVVVASLLAGGALGDLVGPTKGQLLSLAALSVLVFPAYALLGTGHFEKVLLGQVLLAVPIGLYGGMLPYVICSLFPKASRYSGVGCGYNIAQAIFASTCNVLQTWLVLNKSSASLFSWAPHSLFGHTPTMRPALYLLIVAAMAAVAVLCASRMLGIGFSKRPKSSALSYTKTSSFSVLSDSSSHSVSASASGSASDSAEERFV